MPGFIGFPELMLLAIVVLLVFGPKRLPEMGRSLGRGMREFKESVTGDNKSHEDIEGKPAVMASTATVAPPATTTTDATAAADAVSGDDHVKVKA